MAIDVGFYINRLRKTEHARQLPSQQCRTSSSLTSPRISTHPRHPPPAHLCRATLALTKSAASTAARCRSASVPTRLASYHRRQLLPCGTASTAASKTLTGIGQGMRAPCPRRRDSHAPAAWVSSTNRPPWWTIPRVSWRTLLATNSSRDATQYCPLSELKLEWSACATFRTNACPRTG